jgi:3-methyladenine DNA glycosylase AlkD
MIEKELLNLKNDERSKVLKRFFKTGIGEYGEGDIFLGIYVPIIRNVCKKYSNLDLFKIQKLLESKYHEFRFSALIILINKFEKGTKKNKKDIFNFYLKNLKYINNWDLVDVSSHKIIGSYIFNCSKKDINILYTFSKSNNLWKKRIAIISLWYFIRKDNFQDSIKICEILIDDKENLINKACGWMLREIGKRDANILYDFLDKYANIMPRVELRYSVEKLEKEDKLKYLNKKC